MRDRRSTGSVRPSGKGTDAPSAPTGARGFSRVRTVPIGGGTCRGGPPVLDLDQLLRHAVEQRASDIHLKVGSRPMLRIDGILRETTFDLVEPDEAERVALAIMPPRRAERFHDGRVADFVYSAPGRGR